MRLRLAFLISSLVLAISFAGDPVVIHPNKNPTLYKNQLKDLKANPKGKIVRFEGINHPGFELKEVLGEGGATTVFRAVHLGSKKEVALRVPTFKNFSKTDFFDLNIDAAKELQEIQRSQGRRLPVISQIESEKGFFATTEVVNKYTKFSDFKKKIAEGQINDPKFRQMEKDFGLFLRETADIEFLGDFHEDQLVWEELGNGRGRWTIIDYSVERGKTISFSRDVNKSSLVDALFFNFERWQPEAEARIRDYKANIQVAVRALRQVVPFSTSPNPKSVRPLESRESSLPKGGLLNCSQDLDPKNSKTGSASRNTFGKTSSGFLAAINLIQFLPAYNPFAESIGVSCSEARKKMGRMICEWDFPLNPWNNVADCTIVTSVTPIVGIQGESSLSAQKEPVCKVDYRWVGIRVDDEASKAKLKAAGYFNAEGVKVSDSTGTIPTAASLLNALKRKVRVDESQSAESLRFPPEVGFVGQG